MVHLSLDEVSVTCFKPDLELWTKRYVVTISNSSQISQSLFPDPVLAVAELVTFFSKSLRTSSTMLNTKFGRLSISKQEYCRSWEIFRHKGLLSSSRNSCSCNSGFWYVFHGGCRRIHSISWWVELWSRDNWTREEEEEIGRSSISWISVMLLV